MKKILLTIFVTGLVWNHALAGELKYKDIQSAYHQSIQYEVKQKYKKSIHALKKVYQNYPAAYTVNLRLGWLYYLHKKYVNASKHLEKALLISPASIEVLNIVNLIYGAQEDWTKVEEQSVKILKIDYYNFAANHWYSLALKMQEKYDLAIQVSQKMLAVLPTNIIFLQKLGTNLFLNGQITDAQAVFNNLLIISPNNETAIYYKEASHVRSQD